MKLSDRELTTICEGISRNAIKYCEKVPTEYGDAVVYNNTYDTVLLEDGDGESNGLVLTIGESVATNQSVEIVIEDYDEEIECENVTYVGEFYQKMYEMVRKYFELREENLL